MSTSISRSDGEAIRILFAGGCHVAGYPIGELPSFPEVVRGLLEEQGGTITYRRLPYVKLTHAAKLMSACAEHQPDLVILQVGHFELYRPFSQYLRSLLRFRSGSDGWSVPELPARPIRQIGLFRIKSFVKTAIDWILGHRLVDLVRFEAQANEFLRRARASIPGRIILLSPLPCADALAMRYRRIATAILRRVAGENDIEFVDVVSLFSSWTFGPDEHFFDAIHLGATGHRLVGEALSKQIITPLPRVGTPVESR